MKKTAVIATANSLQKAGNSYCQLHGHELAVLDSMPAWMTRLFMCLVRVSNFKTGAGSTTFAQLVLMLTPLQPRSGHKHFVPTEQAIRKGVLAFESSRILARDKARSQGERLLFFAVLERGAQVRSPFECEGVMRRGVDNAQSEQRRGFQLIRNANAKG